MYIVRQAAGSAGMNLYVLRGTAKSINESVPCRYGREIFRQI